MTRPWVTGVHPAVRPRLLTAGPGREDRAAYEAGGGYRPGLAGADLIAAVDAAGLRGRGGAAFPLARKLAAVAGGRSGGRVVVVNGEEGEPTSVKDRWLLRTRPHLVLDGALRAAAAVGASTVYVYVSDGAAAQSAAAALAELDGPRADVRIFRTEPAYVAGEETAAVRAIGGGPALPSDKPPRPFEAGVGGLPTLVSNAETLANLPAIAAGDVRADTFLLTLGGDCPRPGLFEVPLGAPLGETLRLLGGTPDGPVRGHLMGGYFAGLLAAGNGEGLPLGHDELRAAGSGLGCGAVTVLGAADCPVGVAAAVLAYFDRNNAGQCGSCFNGTAAMAGVLSALAHGAAGEADLARLGAWTESLPGRGACGTLDGAAQVARSLLREFPADIAGHLAGPCAVCAAMDLTAPEPYAADPGRIGGHADLQGSTL